MLEVSIEMNIVLFYLLLALGAFAYLRIFSLSYRCVGEINHNEKAKGMELDTGFILIIEQEIERRKRNPSKIADN